MKTVPHAVRRLGWSVADQALTSLASFALSAVVARAVGPATFGAFAIAFAAYVVILNVSRSLGTQPLLIRYAASSDAERRRATSLAAGMVLIVGVVGGLACIVAAWPTGGDLGEALVLFGIMMPGLLLWDLWRYSFFAAARGRSAFAMDFLFLALLFVSLALITLSRSTSLIWPTVAWGGTATLVAVATSVRLRVLPRPLSVGAWWREQRDIASRYVAEIATDMFAGLMSYNGIALATGLATVGALRAAQLLLGPLNVVLVATPFVAMAEGVKLLKRSGRSLRDGCLMLSAALLIATFAWGAVALALPDTVGLIFLGPSWAPARSVLLPAILAAAGSGAIVGPWVGLRSLGAAKQSLRVRVIHSTAMLTCAFGGAVLGGTQGAAWGLATGAWLGVGPWWWQFQYSLNSHIRSGRLESAGEATAPSE